MIRRTRGFRFGLLVFAIVATQLGCGGSDRMALHPVRGKVVVDGKPAVGASISFWGVDDALKAEDAPFPKAVAADDGSFDIVSYQTDSGAPEGRYKVTIEWRKSDESDPEERDLAPDLLNGKYSDLETTPLEVTVNAGDNQLDTFEL